MLIVNAETYVGHHFHQLDLRVEWGRIAEISPRGQLTAKAGEELLDASGLWILPGLTDIHSHGAMGHDFSDADRDGLNEILRFEASCGITQYCPTSMTMPASQLEKIFRFAGEAGRQEAPEGAAWFCGIHMEGPWVNPQKLGAQNPESVQQISWEEFKRFQELSGNLLRIVSLAPEMKGSQDFIHKAAGRLCLSLAHSKADYDTAVEAFAEGMGHVTHLFNAMEPLHHRQPGPITAAYENPAVTIELISDGVHVHPAMIRLAFSLFKDRVCLISDSMRATGLGDGLYDLGGQEVVVKGSEARITTGSLAGSVSSLDVMLRRAVSFGISFEDALYAASELPARVIGIDHEAGVIATGRRANFILSDQAFNFQRIFVNGKSL
ncbi:MAG: N-acetylglucosamine-6-phosphate deacetylase [Clostridiales bacterium]|nr:N-acetylglucosamine-6-phosphate deacetylase [Clostridiales bacterium]MDD7432575.1 N-acetylglucosamine-6-phosphate deacetylase [Clostridiales bacterium]MDY3062152.1 N-acetylglucosamine-6-phosphate deacetylase [Eubacteriales bacterium]